MPEAFDRCVRSGGKVRTQKLGGDKYRHVCILKGKVYPGYAKTKGGGSKSKKNRFTEGLSE
jgi:hypothetical protein